MQFPWLIHEHDESIILLAPFFPYFPYWLQHQGEWLRQMGIDTRTEALQRRNPGDKDKLKRQRDRLVEDDQMGTLFKVLGICGRRWPYGVGFQ